MPCTNCTPTPAPKPVLLEHRSLYRFGKLIEAMLPTRVITGMVMPGGWHFMQEGRFRIEAGGYERLVAAVTNWRLQNGRPVGADVQKEIDDFICHTYPQACHPPFNGAQAAMPIPQPQIFGQFSRFVDQITEWAMRIMGNPAIQNLETEQEANRRAEICIGCPMNEEWEGGCPPCVEHATRLLTMMRRGKDHQVYFKKLHGCKANGHCNRTAIWLPKSVFTSKEGPGTCWLKQ